MPLTRRRKNISRISQKKEVTPDQNQQESFFKGMLTFINTNKSILFFIFLLLTANFLTFAILYRQREHKRKLNSHDNPCEEFNLLAGNLTNANTILIGEWHKRRDLTATCLAEIIKLKGNPEIIFVEGLPSGELIKCEESDLPKNINNICMGWDDEQSLMSLMDEVYSSNALIEVREIYNNLRNTNVHKNYSTHRFDAKFDKELKILQQTCLALVEKASQSGQFSDMTLRPYSKENLLFVKEKIRYLKIHQIQQDRNEGKSYHEIFASASHLKTTSNIPSSNSLVATFTKRNQSLIKTLVNGTGLFKVAITGLNHVAKVGLDKEIDDQVDYVRNELEKNKDKDPYAILGIRL